jgi:hypothetical protein
MDRNNEDSVLYNYESQRYITTDSWPVCLDVSHPSGTRYQFFPFLSALTIVGFLMCGVLSDEIMGL